MSDTTATATPRCFFFTRVFFRFLTFAWPSYLSPILDFGLGYVLDRYLKAIRISDAGIDNAEAALAEHVADLVSLLEGFPGRGDTRGRQLGGHWMRGHRPQSVVVVVVI